MRHSSFLIHRTLGHNNSPCILKAFNNFHTSLSYFISTKPYKVVKVEVRSQRHRILEEAGNVVAWTVSHYLAGAEALCSECSAVSGKAGKADLSPVPFPPPC